jgi:hypothetical protein
MGVISAQILNHMGVAEEITILIEGLFQKLHCFWNEKKSMRT